MIPKVTQEIIDLGDGRTISIETGKLAKQADGSVVVRMGDAMLISNGGICPYCQPRSGFSTLNRRLPRKICRCGSFPGRFFQKRSTSQRQRSI